ncbi:hypothetical protein G4B11_000107 [Aspergillus flavus]|nr:hypothetical protein G4B11_000107 [Aspergillus flavus]
MDNTLVQVTEELTTDDEDNEQTTSFGIHTEKAGEESGYHTRNDPKAPEQRRTITAYHGSVDVQGESLAIIHGELSPESELYATLLVFEFRFDGVKWKNRIPWVQISLEFRSSTLEAAGPVVHAISPQGTYSLCPVDQDEACQREGQIQAGAEQMGVSMGASYGWSKTTNRTTTNSTKIKGFKTCDVYGNSTGVSWTLEENQATKTGVPTYLRTAVCLERQQESKFEANVKLEYVIDGKSWKERFFGATDPNDPILYNPKRAPTNMLQLVYDIDDLESVQLEEIFDASIHTTLQNRVKAHASPNYKGD